MDLVALHARHVKAQPPTRCIEHGVVACTLGAKFEIVAHQQVTDPQRVHEGVLNERFGALAGQLSVEGQHHTLVHTATLQLQQLVAQGGNAGRSQLGLLVQGGEIVARVGFKRHHTTGHATVTRFVDQQGDHGLMAPGHTVEIADRECAALRFG